MYMYLAGSGTSLSVITVFCLFLHNRAKSNSSTDCEVTQSRSVGDVYRPHPLAQKINVEKLLSTDCNYITAVFLFSLTLLQKSANPSKKLRHFFLV